MGLRVMPRHRYGPYRCELLDQINIYAVHTKSAIDELKQIDPVKGEKGIYGIKNYNSLKVDPSMDIALTVWMLTKDSK